MYAIFEEEKGKFEKSVYAWRNLRSGIIEGLLPCSEYTLFLKKGRRSFRKAYTREGLRSGIIEGLASIRYFRERAGDLSKSVYTRRAGVRYLRIWQFRAEYTLFSR